MADERVGIRSSWPDIRSDAELHNVLIQLGRVVDYFTVMLEGGEEASGELMAMIRAELDL